MMKPAKPLNPPLRHALQVQYDAGGTKDAYGATPQNWTNGISAADTQSNMRAAINDKASLETIIGRQLVSIGQMVIQIRFLAGLTAAHRLYEPLTGRIYEIASVNRLDDLPQWLIVGAKQKSTAT